MPENTTTTFVISDLKLDTEYSFSIMAKNVLGESKFLAKSVKARTSSKFYVLNKVLHWPR